MSDRTGFDVDDDANIITNKGVIPLAVFAPDFARHLSANASPTLRLTLVFEVRAEPRKYQLATLTAYAKKNYKIKRRSK